MLERRYVCVYVMCLLVVVVNTRKGKKKKGRAAGVVGALQVLRGFPRRAERSELCAGTCRGADYLL